MYFGIQIENLLNDWKIPDNVIEVFTTDNAKTIMAAIALNPILIQRVTLSKYIFLDNRHILIQYSFLRSNMISISCIRKYR